MLNPCHAFCHHGGMCNLSSGHTGEHDAGCGKFIEVTHQKADELVRKIGRETRQEREAEDIIRETRVILKCDCPE